MHGDSVWMQRFAVLAVVQYGYAGNGHLCPVRGGGKCLWGKEINSSTNLSGAFWDFAYRLLVL